MRGKVTLSQPESAWSGITPAHAGKSRPRIPEGSCRRDHPRPCGEKSTSGSTIVPTRGSPPPMRGKGLRMAAFILSIRITPAHAGKSCTTAVMYACAWDHPRPCGEKSLFKGYVESRPGSPPPMRGKEEVYRLKQVTGRITPAHAGKR